MYFILGMICGFVIIVAGFCLGGTIGYVVCYNSAIRAGGFEWLGRNYRVTPNGPASGDDAIKDIIKNQFKAGAYDGEIERGVRRNQARKDA